MNLYTTQDEKQLTADYGKYLTLTATAVEDKDLPLCKIVHLPLTESTGDWQEIGEDRAAEIRAAKAAAAGNVAELARQVTQLGEQTAAALQAAQQAQQTAEEAAQGAQQNASQGAQQNASQARLTAMLINTYDLSDEQALAVKDLFPTWDDCVKKGKELPADFKLTDGGKLYKVLQAHTPQSDWKPSGTPSLYGLVSVTPAEEHAGTQEDPIPYVQMMLLEQGKYYTQDGILYLCIQSTLTGYPNDLKDLASLVQKVEE